MAPQPDARLRTATPEDSAFVVEMARHASIIEDWPLPDAGDDDVLELLPVPGVVPIVAEDQHGVAVGAVWIYYSAPTLLTNADGGPVPELCIGVAPGGRGAGIGGLLLDALFAELSANATAVCANVHVRNPAKNLYERKGFRVVGPGNGPLGIAMIKDL